MKKSIFLIILLGFISTAFSDITDIKAIEKKDKNEIIWQSDYDAAIKLAKKKKKTVLIYFTGSDWCGPCIQLHKDLFDTKEFSEIATKNLILYKADFPRKTDSGITEVQKIKNNELKSQFQVPGFPTVILLNSKGEVIGKQIGYNKAQTTEPHMKTIKDAIEKYN